MLKKITFCVMAVLGAASALAAHGNDMPLAGASGVNLIAPDQEGSWSFGAQLNYFEANNNFNYAEEYPVVTPAEFTNQYKTDMVDPGYKWGWGVDVTYHFPGGGRDVTLAFTQLNSSESNSTSVNSDTVSLAPGGLGSTGDFPFPLFDDAPYTDAQGKVTTNYDAADLTFGQVIDIGHRISLHPFAGVRYAYIDYKATGQYQYQVEGDPVTKDDSQTLKSKFQGVGPRLGSDAAVNLGRGFSVGATLGVSLLAGNIDTHYLFNIAVYNADDPADDYAYENPYDGSPKGTRLVPEADAKLSARYNTDMGNGYALGFEVGYQATNYFDVITNTTYGAVDTALQYTNFLMQGPYARLQLDVA